MGCLLLREIEESREYAVRRKSALGGCLLPTAYCLLTNNARWIK
jgi:hypothetical protein